MHPILFESGGLVLYSHTAILLVAFVVAGLVRRRESRRLGYGSQPGYRWVAVGALAGAVIGSKVGMLLYLDPAAWGTLFEETLRLETSGKTVIGALAGGYAGVEIAKKLVGIRTSTGDAFAVAVPLALGIGRIACFMGGCCYGTPSSLPWAVHIAGADRHPVQLYEAAIDFALAAAIYLARDSTRRAGDLFKLSLIGYALARVLLDPWRGDPRIWLGPVSGVQLACVLASVALGLALLRAPRSADAHP